MADISEDMVDLEVGDEDSLGLRASSPESQSGGGDRLDCSDPPDGPDDSDVEQSALQQFASALQRAQEIAVQIERDQKSQKRRTPKTYRGNSRTTLYRREKARKSLASKGYLDLGSFLALKGKERRELEANEREREDECGGVEGGGEGASDSSKTPAMADRTITGGHKFSEGGEDNEDNIVLIPSLGPSVPPRSRSRGACATDGDWSGAVDCHGLGRAVRKNCDLAEEDESGSDDEEDERNKRRTVGGRLQSARCTDKQGRAAAAPGLRPAVRKRHALAEEEESGSDEEEGDENKRRTERV